MQRRRSGGDSRMYVEWFRNVVKEAKISQNELARQMSEKLRTPYYSSTLSKMAAGKRRIRLDEAVAIASILEVPLPEEETRRAGTPLVGYVGGGAQAIMFEEGQIDDLVETPPGAGPDTVALQVRGDSMYGVADDGSLIYYDDRREGVDKDFIGRLCVVGLDDGRVLIKRLERGSDWGKFDLISTNAAPIRAADVNWAARVTWIKPR